MNKKLIATVVAVGVAISVGATSVASAHGGMGGKGGKGSMAGKSGENRVAEQAVVTSTLGITADVLNTRLKAGESLATIAGVKKDALITALVVFHSQIIDARVTAGKLTAAQATTAKANLTAMVTAKVNSAYGFGKKGFGKGFKGAATNTSYTPGSIFKA
jgi:uncharacterized membrane protein (DUF4010 family)